MKKSHLIAVVFSVLLILWMLSGWLFNSDQSEQQASSSKQAQDSLFTVKVEKVEALSKVLHIEAQGQVEPNRILHIKSQTAGSIKTLHASEGQAVSKDTLLLSIDMRDRALGLQQQEAILAARSKAYTRILETKQFQSEGALENAFAELQAAKVAVAQIKRDISYTEVRAPFAGLVQTYVLEEGDYAPVNEPLLTLVDNDPLVVSMPIAQQDIGAVNLGSAVEVTLGNGKKALGTLRYIAPKADEATRTFRVEVEVPNPNDLMPSGISASASIPSTTVSAHYVSPALFSLNDAGEIGIKTVEGDVVAFNPVEIVQSDANGSWVTGLPSSAMIIVRGQGFVQGGTRVDIELVTTNTDRSADSSSAIQ